MKKLAIILILLCLTACSQEVGLGGAKKQNERKKVDKEIKKEMQNQYKKKEFKKMKIEGQDVEFHHYETPKGEIGYQVIQTKEEDGKIYQRSFDPTNKKIEKQRYYDWKIIQDNNSIANTSTSTDAIK